MTRVIGLTGGLGSGKDSWGNFLASNFFGTHESTSQVTREYIEQNNLGPLTRDRVREVSTLLRRQRGEDYLARMAFKRAQRAAKELIIISGLYVPAESDYIRGKSGKVVHINAPNSLRFERAKLRSREGEDVENEEFERLDKNDFCSSTTDQRMEDVILGADYELDGTVPIKNIESCFKIAEMLLKELYEG